jgi:selenide,water dikinase
VLGQIPHFDDPRLLSQDIPFADAGIFRIDEKRALVQSVDFFTPVVDDPFVFGQIAAANALSDLYAVGATPLTALSLVGFPLRLGEDVLAEVLKGGAERVVAAGAVIAGGHSVEDDEPKYGLAVTGMVEIDRMMTSVNCRVGDRLLLTKPLGNGILAAALKGEVVDEQTISPAIEGMKTLNAAAARACLDLGVRAATDITGFGLLGHSMEMAAASHVCFEIDSSCLPIYPHVREMAALGLLPAGLHRNRNYYLSKAVQAAKLDDFSLDLLCDPQTSGGLLISVAEDLLPALQGQLAAAEVVATEIGRVVTGEAGVVIR